VPIPDFISFKDFSNISIFLLSFSSFYTNNEIKVNNIRFLSLKKQALLSKISCNIIELKTHNKNANARLIAKEC